VHYWKKKLEDPSFHSCSWGGDRSSKFTSSEKEVVYSILFAAIQEVPDLKLDEYAELINHLLDLDGKHQVILSKQTDILAFFVTMLTGHRKLSWEDVTSCWLE